MADKLVEFQGLRFKLHDNGDGSFSLTTHDIGGGAGVADQSIEVQGYRVLAHDNGDASFSVATTTSSGAGDVLAEFQGIRVRLHPTGGTQTIGGISTPVYAVGVFAV